MVFVAVFVVGGVGDTLMLAGPTRQQLHMPGEGIQLGSELLVLLLELCHNPGQRGVRALRLLQTTLHPQLEGTYVCADVMDGVLQGGLVAGQRCAHRLPPIRRRKRKSEAVE